MPRSTRWNLKAPPAPTARGSKSRLWLALGFLALLMLGLGVVGLRASIDHPRLAETLFHALDTDAQAQQLYRKEPGLQVGYGSEEAFLGHLHAWKPRFGTTESFTGPDAAKRFLPFAAKLEVQGSGGAWFAILARQGPWPKVHGIAFEATRERARSACFNQYAKRYLKDWLERGLAHARSLAEGPSEGIVTPLTDSDRQGLRCLPQQVQALDPTCFSFQLTSTGPALDLDVGPERRLSLGWQGDSPQSAITAVLTARPH